MLHATRVEAPWYSKSGCDPQVPTSGHFNPQEADDLDNLFKCADDGERLKLSENGDGKFGPKKFYAVLEPLTDTDSDMHVRPFLLVKEKDDGTLDWAEPVPLDAEGLKRGDTVIIFPSWTSVRHAAPPIVVYEVQYSAKMERGEHHSASGELSLHPQVLVAYPHLSGSTTLDWPAIEDMLASGFPVFMDFRQVQQGVDPYAAYNITSASPQAVTYKLQRTSGRKRVLMGGGVASAHALPSKVQRGEASAGLAQLAAEGAMLLEGGDDNVMRVQATPVTPATTKLTPNDGLMEIVTLLKPFAEALVERQQQQKKNGGKASAAKSAQKEKEERGDASYPYLRQEGRCNPFSNEDSHIISALRSRNLSNSDELIKELGGRAAFSDLKTKMNREFTSNVRGKMVKAAREGAERGYQHHPKLQMWRNGSELQENDYLHSLDGVGVAKPYSHPMFLAALVHFCKAWVMRQVTTTLVVADAELTEGELAVLIMTVKRWLQGSILTGKGGRQRVAEGDKLHEEFMNQLHSLRTQFGGLSNLLGDPTCDPPQPPLIPFKILPNKAVPLVGAYKKVVVPAEEEEEEWGI